MVDTNLAVGGNGGDDKRSKVKIKFRRNGKY